MKEESDEDIGEIMAAKKKFAATEKKMDIAYHINCWNLYT